MPPTIDQITPAQKKEILAAIKRDGFMSTGYCRRKGLDVSLFYRVINNNRGFGGRKSPKSDEVIATLINDGYLSAPIEETV